MADAPISGLPETTTVGDNDLILLEQSGVAKKVKGQNWKQYFSANVVSAEANTIEPDVDPSAYFNRNTGKLTLSLPSADYIDTVTKTGTVHLTDTYTITSKLGHTATFTVTNGAGAVDTVNEQPADGNGNVSLVADNIPMDDTDSIQDHVDTIEQDIRDMLTAIEHKAPDTLAPTEAVADLNVIADANVHLYKYSSSTLNSPYKAGVTVNSAGVVLSYSNDGDTFAVQFCVASGNNSLYMRSKVSGTWSGWIALTSPRIVTIQLPASWTQSSTDVYTQTITVSGTTSKSKIDLQPDAATILQLVNDGVSGLYVTNNNGALTAYAVGEAPTEPLNVQATVYETA